MMNTIKYYYSFHLLIIIIFIYLIILPINSYGYILNSINNNNNNNSIKQNSTNVISNWDDSAKIIRHTDLFGTSAAVISESAEATEEGRTFRVIKKLQMSLLPIMFILGVKSTVLLLVLALSIKSVGIGLIILMINIGFIIAKFVALFKSKEEHHPHYSEHHSGGWGPPPVWEPPTSTGQNKEIHVHIHNDDKHKHHTSYEPYGSYSSNNGQIYVGPSSSRTYQIDDKGGGRKKPMINDYEDYDPIEKYMSFLYGN